MTKSNRERKLNLSEIDFISQEIDIVNRKKKINMPFIIKKHA